jgi:hypothetical protein
MRELARQSRLNETTRDFGVITLVDSLGATTKFVKFCITHRPEVPPMRPEQEHRVPWTTAYLRQALGTIYHYRSLALHEGIPFPAPMCAPPRTYGDALAERQAYGGAGAMGGIWSAADLPIFLHVFEYIARNALLSWWDCWFLLLPRTSPEFATWKCEAPGWGRRVDNLVKLHAPASGATPLHACNDFMRTIPSRS